MKCETSTNSDDSCCTHMESFGESVLGDEIREHPEDCSTLGLFTQTEDPEIIYRVQMVYKFIEN